MTRLHLVLALITPTLFEAQLTPNSYSGTGTDPCSRGLVYMYPFGAATSDSLGNTGDDNNCIAMSWGGTPFKFYGVNYNLMYFSTNSWLCFTTNDASLSGILFPSYTNPVCRIG